MGRLDALLAHPRLGAAGIAKQLHPLAGPPRDAADEALKEPCAQPHWVEQIFVAAKDIEWMAARPELAGAK